MPSKERGEQRNKEAKWLIGAEKIRKERIVLEMQK